MKVLDVVDGKVQTLTGRWIPKPPDIRLDSNRRCINDLRKYHQWLRDQFIAECQARNDEFNLVSAQQYEVVAEPPPASQACALLYLFGDDQICWPSTPKEKAYCLWKYGFNNSPGERFFDNCDRIDEIIAEANKPAGAP